MTRRAARVVSGSTDQGYAKRCCPSHDPATGAAAFTAVTDTGGQHAAALRFGDPRAQALRAALLVFHLQPDGFTNADLRTHLTPLLGANPDTWPAAPPTTYAGDGCTASEPSPVSCRV